MALDDAAIASPVGKTGSNSPHDAWDLQMRVAVFSAQSYDRRFLDEANSREGGPGRIDLTYQDAALSAATAALAKGSDAVCLFVNDRADAGVLDALAAAGVRAVFLRCAGSNNVDAAAAPRLGLFVARVPAYSPEAVAEHAIALIMTLNRQTHRAFNRVREGNFMLDGLMGMTLHGKTVGIVGTGRIGLATARILKGIGCRVLGSDPVRSEAFNAIGERVELETLLSRSDVVTLHCADSDEVARSFRFHVAHHSGMMSPGFPSAADL